MATVPYQSTYSLQPKYGTRYGPSQFAPTVSTAASPEVLGTQSPAVVGTGAGTTTQAANYTQDPFAQPGFRSAQPGYAYPYPGTTTTPYIPPTPMEAPPIPAATNQVVVNAMQAAGGEQKGGGVDRIPAAQSLGYTPGTQNPMNLVLAGVPFGSMIADTMGLNKDYTYGTYGTYDTQGNVFGTEGRAYDPITGIAANSYGTPTDFYGNMFGPTGSYGKLRAAGESIPGSLLGSYERSLYAQQELNPSLNTAQARAAMARGTADARGVPTIQGLIEANTALANPDYAASQGFESDYVDMLSPTTITPEMIGFDGSRPTPKNISGVFGTNPGDLARTSSGQIGVINEAGQIETPTGTVVGITDPYTGEKISLLGSTVDGKSRISAQTELARNQALDALANPEGSGMSGFNVSDGKGGSYQTDSSGTAGAFTGGVTGMEDEYDGPSGGGGGGGSGGKG